MSRIWTGVLVAVCLTLVAAPVGAALPSAVTAQDDVNGPLHTDYFAITYEDGNRAEAERIATFADDYYEILFQRFGVEPVDEKIPIKVVDDVDCELDDAEGCYKSGVKATIYVTSDSRRVFYHELTHRFQAKAMEGGTWINPPGAIDKHEVFVEGTARYLDAPTDDIAASASFRAEDVPMTTKDAAGGEYADLALFAEFVLHEYGRKGFDMLYTRSDPREVASLSDGDYSELIEEFYDQLPQQEARMADGGAPLPGFTYDPFLPEPGSEVTFDARTPSAIERLGRSWYDGEAESYEWDFDSDGEIDATGPTVTRTIADPANATVTLYVTVDGERRKAEQDLLDSSMGLDRTAVEPVFEVTDLARGTGLDYEPDREADDRAVAGERVSLNVTVENRGITGTERVEVLFGDRRVADRKLGLVRGETRRLTVDHAVPSDLEPGTYDYRVRIGNRTWNRTVYVERARLAVSWDSISVPNGTEGWLRDAMVKPGKRMTITAEATANDGNLAVNETVRLYFGDEVVGEKTVEFGSGTSHVTFEFTVPPEVGTHRIRATILANDTTASVAGFDRRIEVKEQVGIAEATARSSAGQCTVTVTSASVESVYKADESEWRDERNVTEIEPGDDVSLAINALRNPDCGDVSKLPVEIDGESATAREKNWGTRQYYFELTRDFDEPGEYEVRAGGTVLVTIDVTSESGQSTEGGKPDGSTEQDDSTEGEADDETPTPNQSPDAPGFGVLVAVVALLVAAVIRGRSGR